MHNYDVMIIRSYYLLSFVCLFVYEFVYVGFDEQVLFYSWLDF